MGVRKSASCLMTAETHADIGVEQISDGNEADRGVCSGGSTGLVTAVGDMVPARIILRRQEGCRQRVGRQPNPEM